MKDQLQKELLEKVKPGTKPSHLKRSKSLNDIPKAPPLPKSEVEQLKAELAQVKAENQATLERLKGLHDFAKSSNSSLTNPAQALSTLTSELKKQTDLTSLLQDQLKEKQKEIETLRKDLEENQANQAPAQELDHSLVARHQNLKDWFSQYQKTQSLDQELAQNIDQASTELTTQDQKIRQLRTNNSKLKQENQNLARELKLVQGVAELRRTGPFPSPGSPDLSLYLKFALYASLALWLLISLIKAKPDLE